MSIPAGWKTAAIRVVELRWSRSRRFLRLRRPTAKPRIFRSKALGPPTERGRILRGLAREEARAVERHRRAGHRRVGSAQGGQRGDRAVGPTRESGAERETGRGAQDLGFEQPQARLGRRGAGGHRRFRGLRVDRAARGGGDHDEDDDSRA